MRKRFLSVLFTLGMLSGAAQAQTAPNANTPASLDQLLQWTISQTQGNVPYNNGQVYNQGYSNQGYYPNQGYYNPDNWAGTNNARTQNNPGTNWNPDGSWNPNGYQPIAPVGPNGVPQPGYYPSGGQQPIYNPSWGGQQPPSK